MDAQKRAKLKADIDRICGVGPIPSFRYPSFRNGMMSFSRLSFHGRKIRSIRMH